MALTFLSGRRPHYPLALAATVVVAGVVARVDRPDSARARSVPRLIGINVAFALPLSTPITVCRGLRGTWAQRWPDFRHVN